MTYHALLLLVITFISHHHLHLLVFQGILFSLCA